MAIGAQGYSIGDAIRTLLGQVLDVMYFKKWLAVDLKRRVRAAAFADALGLFQYPGAYLWVANKSDADGRDLLRLGNGERQVLSASPELFFDWNCHQLLMRPMKGTAPRHADPQADAAAAEGLRASAKERAENVMIVDLVRHDVSRVAEPHSVRVPRLFHLEPLPTVWQMTSDITARKRQEDRLAGLYAELQHRTWHTRPRLRAWDLPRLLWRAARMTAA